MQPCRVVAISHSPLRETHKFATIPAPDGQSGFSMVISRAGDWTAKIINAPPKQIWIKGVPAWGVLRVAVMFDPVVIVATGSGIGPCLGHILDPSCPTALVWSTKDPERSFGRDMVDDIKKQVPHAVIWDTNKQGRPDMVKIAHNMWTRLFV